MRWQYRACHTEREIERERRVERQILWNLLVNCAWRQRERERKRESINSVTRKSRLRKFTDHLYRYCFPRIVVNSTVYIERRATTIRKLQIKASAAPASFGQNGLANVKPIRRKFGLRLLSARRENTETAIAAGIAIVLPAALKGTGKVLRMRRKYIKRECMYTFLSHTMLLARRSRRFLKYTSARFRARIKLTTCRILEQWPPRPSPGLNRAYVAWRSGSRLPLGGPLLLTRFAAFQRRTKVSKCAALQKCRY